MAGDYGIRHDYCGYAPRCIYRTGNCTYYGMQYEEEEEETKVEETKQMSKKYYRVVKDTPAWKQGAIIEGDSDGYKPINDLWDAIEDLKNYEETAQVVENAPDFFERVYAMGKAQKMVFVTKEKAQELASKYFTGE